MASASSSTGKASSTARDPTVSTATTAGPQRQTPNGVGAKPVNSSAKDTPSELDLQDHHSHDRLCFLLANFVGLPVRITTKTGQGYSGIFSKASLDTPDIVYKLKMVKEFPLVQGSKSNGVIDGEAYVGSGSDHEMTFSKGDVHTLSAERVAVDKSQAMLTNGTASSFRTDTDISGHRMARERELQPWQPTQEANSSLSLHGNGGLGWDQFETNERLYNVKSDYDENLYTTTIDRSAPSYKQRLAIADRKAREIEGAAGGSFQSREDADEGLDEEERFSGVRRGPQPLTSSSSNRYTTPARRAPTGQPTVPGAPVDPAIISSQLARPETTKGKKPSPPPQSQVAHVTEELKKENSAPNHTGGSNPSHGSATLASADASTQPTKPDLLASKPAATISSSRSPGPKSNATDTVAKDLLDSFKQFSASEKLRMQEQQRRGVRRDKEVKMNDLKKFAANFKLHTPVPPDMLGILAKSEPKQKEILERSRQEVKDSKTPSKSVSAPQSSEQQTPTPSQVDLASNMAAPSEPSSGRGGKTSGNRGFQNARNERFQNGHGNGSGSRGSATGNLGQRLMRQQYMPGPIPPHQQQMQHTGPAAIRTDIAVPHRQSIPTPNSAASARFNVQAMEFKPNPTATMMSPPPNNSSMSTSRTASRSVSKTQSPTKKTFFEHGRPKPRSEHKSIHDCFNPIKRMKAEAEKDGKTKDNANNDGIPPAFTTRPTWDVHPENENRSYMDMFDRGTMPTIASNMPPNGVLPHQHQLPLHLQQHPVGPQPHGQNHTPRFGQPQMQQGPRDQHFDDPRAQYNSSQHSMYSSPRPMNGMHQLPLHAPPMYGQPHFMIAGPNGHMMPYRPGPGGPPQMMGMNPGQVMGMPMHPGAAGGQYMAVPGQPGQMMMPSPGQGHVYPNQGGPHAQSNYSSPRHPPAMMHSNSQQGHGAPMMYPNGSQQGQPPMYYMSQQNQQMGQMRGGGYPMQSQGSHGPSPYMQYQQPMPRGGPQQLGNFPAQQQHMHPG